MFVRSSEPGSGADEIKLEEKENRRKRRAAERGIGKTCETIFIRFVEANNIAVDDIVDDHLEQRFRL